LDSELIYPRTQSHSGGLVSAGETTREEAFARALIGVETLLSERMYTGGPWPLLEFIKDKSEPYMEVINRFLEPVLEGGLAKHAAETKAGLADHEGKTLLDSLLRETTGWVTSKLHRGPSH